MRYATSTGRADRLAEAMRQGPAVQAELTGKALTFRQVLTPAVPGRSSALAFEPRWRLACAFRRAAWMTGNG